MVRGIRWGTKQCQSELVRTRLDEDRDVLALDDGGLGMGRGPGRCQAGERQDGRGREQVFAHRFLRCR